MELIKLPEFPAIKVEDIPPCSALLYYGVMPLTSWYANRRFKHPYKPGAYHAAFYIWNGLSLQVGKFHTIQKIEKDFSERKRIDVVAYPNITDKVRKDMATAAFDDADEPKLGFNKSTYGVFDFLRFEPLLRWLPRSKKEICSENTYRMFAKCGVKIAEKPPKTEVAPWNIFEYAVAHPEECKVYTVWVGKDYKYK